MVVKNSSFYSLTKSDKVIFCAVRSRTTEHKKNPARTWHTIPVRY